MSKFESEKKILSELLQAREAIKRKHSLSKQEKNDFEKKMSDTFKPVISPLEKLIYLHIENSEYSKEVFNTNSKNKIKKRLRFDDSIVDKNLKSQKRILRKILHLQEIV